MNKEQRFRALSNIGCIVCLLHYNVFTPCAIHHLIGSKYRSTGKKAYYTFTIGLCPRHHQYGTKEHPSVHSHPELFKEKYGSQEELLNTTDNIIKDVYIHGL